MTACTIVAQCSSIIKIDLIYFMMLTYALGLLVNDDTVCHLIMDLFQTEQFT